MNQQSLYVTCLLLLYMQLYRIKSEGNSTASINLEIRNRNESSSEDGSFYYDYGIESHPLPYSDLCKEIGFCEIQADLKVSACKCDDLCVMYNDCCHDFRKENYTFKEMGFGSKSFSCINVSSLSAGIPDYLSVGYYMIISCNPSFLNSTEERLCQSTDDLSVPVIGSGITYRNRHCAKCNNVTEFQYFSVRYEDKSKDSIIIRNFSGIAWSDILSNEKMTISMQPPSSSNPRQCFVNPIVNHNIVDCTRYINPIMLLNNDGEPVWYRNGNCANQEISTPDNFVCFHIMPILHDLFPLSVLMNFQNNEDFPPRDGNLQRNIIGSDYSCWLENINKNYSYCEKTAMVANLILEFGFDFSIISSTSQSSEYIYQYLHLIRLALSSVNFLSVTIYQQLHTVEQPLENACFVMQLKIIEPGIPITEVSLLQRHVHSMIFDILGSDSVSHNENSARISFRSSCTGDGDVLAEIPDIGVAQAPVLEQIEHTSCRYVKISYDAYRFSQKVSIVIPKAISCQNTTELITQMPKGSTILAILTYVCFSISLLALGITLFICRKLKLPSSVPVDNMIHIMVLLFLSMSLFMVGIGANDFKLVCTSISVVLHFLWLSVFSFQSLSIAYLVIDIFAILTSFRNFRSSRKMSLLLGYGFPIIISVSGLVLDLCHCTDLDIKYGTRVCFPSGYHASVYFVALPISFCIILNVVLLTILAVKLKQHSVRTARQTGKAAKRNIGIFFRLTISSGIFWIFEIVKGIWSHEYLEFISVCLNGFQGLFVAASFLSSTNIRRQMRIVFLEKSSEFSNRQNQESNRIHR